ncbi:hypothetical protein KIH13_16640 [Pseudomonas viridiflava]|nr:hypothetical protein KIH13_16640 [Pseudomonas viridiflava]
MKYKILTSIFLFVIAGLTFAQDDAKYLQGTIIQGPYNTSVVEGRGELSVLETGDKDFPLSLVLDVSNAEGGKIRELVDKYDIAGSDPKVESIFFYPVKNKKHVFVLVSWELTSRGIGTYGTLYQVYAYERNKNNKLVPDKKITADKQMSGIEGYQEGQEQHFGYKNAESIKAYIKNNIK